MTVLDWEKLGGSVFDDIFSHGFLCLGQLGRYFPACFLGRFLKSPNSILWETSLGLVIPGLWDLQGFRLLGGSRFFI